jgi:predicted glycoside hydrolase/deacetylase ChbG (UPF0249 family)
MKMNKLWDTIKNSSFLFLTIFLSIESLLTCQTNNKSKNDINSSSDKIIVGAIRWDAWMGGPVTKEVEKTLAPLKYHSRLPWFAKVINDSTVQIDGSSQKIMDTEIDFAADAGLDYWAFLLYPEYDSMSKGLAQYLNSSKRNKINFCLILHNAFGVDESQWPTERDRAIALLQEPTYQKVLDGRPLVYAFMLNYKGSFPTARFHEFQTKVHEKGINPYFVFMGWNPTDDFRTASSLGFDAVSAYAYASSDSTYHQLCQRVKEDYWQNAYQGKVPYIPLITTGWEKTPRKDHPVSWEIGQSYHQQKFFPSIASPNEIALHLQDGLTFVREHRDICVANALIIYAWNEYDEGGWIAPTWTPQGIPNTERLKAIKDILSNKKILTEKDKTNAEKLGFPKGKKVLLFHMDDLGMCKEANEAGKFYIGNDKILSGSVMMPCEYAESFIKWAKNIPKADIGVHLTLTSEWKTWRWGPLSDAEKVPGLIDPEGKMWGNVQNVVMNATPQEVELEVREQINQMLTLGYHPTHIDTHMGALYCSPEFLKVFLKVAEEYRIPANAIDLSTPERITLFSKLGYPVNDKVINTLNNYILPKLDNFTAVPDGNSYEEKKANFFKMVNSLNPGLTEIIFHPSIETKNLKIITDSWQQRVWESKMFSDPEIINFIQKNGIIITTWQEIMKRFEKIQSK